MRILAKNLLILASAGSGKTFQLGNRVIGLVAKGAEPSSIVALTFTRKAAGEFADSVLTKLALAAEDGARAEGLRREIGLADADFKAILERVVRSLPRLTLGTMDSFFARVVRAFQYELGLAGGTFQLIEGPQAGRMVDELLAAVLGDALGGETGDAFFHAFRRATIGKEEQGTLASLRGYVNRWQQRLESDPSATWGPLELAAVEIDDWEKHKSQLAAAVRTAFGEVDFSLPNSQPEALVAAIEALESHSIGSGSLGSGKIPALLASILEAAASSGEGPLTVKFRKEFLIGGRCAERLRDMVGLAARCELAAAIQRTRAIRGVVEAFDQLHEQRLRSKGLLGFHDVKVLMGAWAKSEEARLRREAVDFRLDARIQHWLLDEFQDTSRADWLGLFPLIDEAATRDDGSLFVVGDTKQAIYGWRGGDVRLFSELIEHYQGADLTIEPMAESWRSCPEVLSLVNRICGDLATMNRLFGSASSRWQWETHVPAPPLAQPGRRGESRVEQVGDWTARLERCAELLRELGVGQRQMTCGILLRGNEKVRETADFLRSQGFDVIEEGRRLPAADNPIGLAIAHLFRWLANPDDNHAREVLAMSPLGGVLLAAGDGAWWRAWDVCTSRMAAAGFAATVEGWIEPLWHAWSDFGKRRAGDLLAALGDLDARGVTSFREAADWLERLEVAQSPGVAAVQVMTIHKSKGLGFDAVILPEIPDDVVPLSQYFDIAEGPGWLTETPPKWARSLIPELRDAEERWAESQRYEAFCMLYVALTRAKRGLYVLMPEPSEKADPDKPSLANWIRHALEPGKADGLLYQDGGADWVDALPCFEARETIATDVRPGPAVPKRKRLTPSHAVATGTQPGLASSGADSGGGLAFGDAVHGLLESIAWADESPAPPLPDNEAGRMVAKLLATPSLASVFQRNQRPITLLREQPIDALIDGALVSGVIDRLHLHRHADGGVAGAEIIDFKTDAVEDPRDLIARHAAQIETYRDAVARVFPGVPVSAFLLSVPHAALLPVAAPCSVSQGNENLIS